MTRYAEIIFDQGDEAAEVIDRLENIEDGWLVHGATEETIAAAIEHLLQWDYGEEPHTFIEHPTGNHREREAIVGDLLLTWHLDLGYVALYRAV